MSEAEHPVSRENPPRNSHCGDDPISLAAEHARDGLRCASDIREALRTLELSAAGASTHALARVLAQAMFDLAGDITIRARFLQASAASDD